MATWPISISLLSVGLFEGNKPTTIPEFMRKVYEELIKSTVSYQWSHDGHHISYVTLKSVTQWKAMQFGFFHYFVFYPETKP